LELPIELNGQTKVHSFLVVPKIKRGFVFGIDFWKGFGIINELLSTSCDIVLDREAEVDEMVVVAREQLEGEQEAELKKLVDKYQSTLGRKELGCTHLLEYHIDTGDAKPIKKKHYSYSPKMLEVLHSGLDEWLKLGVVEPSWSPWASPVLLVKKPDGKYRWVVDLREVNKVTKKDSYPIPKVSEILDQLREARFLTSLDLTSAYFQIPLDTSSREKTAFVVPGRGLFHFTRLPQGLTSSAAIWQRFIDRVLGEDVKPNVFVYLDDIIIVNKTFEEHLALIEKILGRLEAAGLTINFEKSQFCRDSLKYLGYVVNQYGLQVDPEKVRSISEFKRPVDVKSLRRFIGMASWYRRFVPGFSSIMEPLHALTSKNCKFRWSQECESAFLAIKEKLITAPVLACPDFEKPFDLFVDGSQTGLGGILSQEGRVVAYASRSLTKAEKKYCPTEIECLAVLWCIEKFKGYLEGYSFNVITDHSSLRWLDNLKDPCGRLGRWAVRLQQFDYKVIHRKGKDQEAPDALSRSPLPYEGDSVDLLTVEVVPKDPWYLKMVREVQSTPERYPAWKVEGNQLYKLVDRGLLETRWNRVMPKELRGKALEEGHDSLLGGHFGITKTYHRVNQYYYWPKMRRDVRKHVSACHTCMQYKIPAVKSAGLMGRQRKVNDKFQVISSDIVGPFPKSSRGFNYLIVSTCLYSKYVWLRPLRRATGEAVRDHLLEDIFLKFAVPGILLTDNGKQFKCREVEDLCRGFGVQVFNTFFYHPQSNPTERVNRVVKTLLGSYIGKNQRNWDRNLNYVAASINTAVHEVTGYTPHFLLFGEEWHSDGAYKRVYCDKGHLPEIERDKKPVLSEQLEELRESIVQRLQRAYNINSRYYNMRRRDVDYQVGQVVYRRNFEQSSAADYFSAKLAPKFVGPFTIEKKIGYKAYLLRDVNGKTDGPWHVKDLKAGPESGDEGFST